MFRALLVVLTAAAAFGCRGTAPFVYECNVDVSCESKNEPGRRCLFDGDTGGYCARPDTSCPSGYRWINLALPKIANQCVDPPLVTAPDAGADS